MPADVRDAPAALLWDFDGTLVESEPCWREAEARLMAELGATITLGQSLSLVGLSLPESTRRLLAWAGRSDLDPVAHAEVLARYASEAMAGGVPYRPGARELLAAARDAGVPCALVSMSYTLVLEPFVAALPEGSFAVVVGGDQVARGKPHPEPYLTAARRLGVDPASCLVLEDSGPGTESAHHAGIPCLGVRFEAEISDGPRRRVVDSLAGWGLDDVAAVWRELSRA